MILRKIPFVNKKTLFPGGLPVVAAEVGQQICSKIQNGGAARSNNPCSSSSEEEATNLPWLKTRDVRLGTSQAEPY